MKRYHDRFPAAPQALVSGLAAACQIPTIVGARVGRDGSVFLDIFQNSDWSLDLNRLIDIANFFQVQPEDFCVEGGPGPETMTVTLYNTCFDFSEQFVDQDLPGEGDSEESIEAIAALAASRRD